MDLTGSIVTLDRIITHRKEFICIDDLHSYKRCRVQCNVKGIVLRDTVLGADIKTKKQQVCKVNDFLVAEIDAKMGGFGIVSEDLEGAIVSSHYFLYEVNKELVDRKFLDFYIRTPSFINQVSAQGSTNYAAIRSEEVLQYQIPLPSLEEQRRIVGRIEELAGKIAEARGLRESAIEETNLIRTSFYNNIFSKYEDKFVSIENLVGRANLKNGKSLRPDEQKSSIRCLRLSALRNGQIDCHDSKMVPMTEEEAEPYIVRSEDVFIVRGNGSRDLIGQAGIIKKVLSNTIFPDLLIRVPIDPNQILPDFFVAWWNSPQMREKILEAAKTTSGIWKINQGHIASFSVPVPSRSEQRRIVDYIREFESQIAAVQLLRQEALKELDALLPTILNKAFKGEL